MTIKRGVSLYSYQQTQFFKELDLEGQIREVGTNLGGADGIEIVDEMSLHYPDPGAEFTREWFSWMEQYGTKPVAMDVGMDVLQFRDHVMSYDECADRLIHDITLAKSLGFNIVRTLSVVPIEVIEKALPHAEKLDVKLGKELHQPMVLEGPQAREILDLAERTGSEHVGLVPDLGIFQFRPSDVQLDWYKRKGAQQSACDAVVDLSLELRDGKAPFGHIDMSRHTAGNLRADFGRFIRTRETSPEFTDAFNGVIAVTNDRVENPTDLDYTVVSEALMLSHTSTDTLRELTGRITHIHGKFNNMSEIPGRPGQYQDISIDYAPVVQALKDGGYDGYIDTEYEGQRYFQDRGVEDLENEVEQVRRHQEMLARLIAS
ncbi:xylose isomerase [Leifsonia shinshuensis]